MTNNNKPNNSNRSEKKEYIEKKFNEGYKRPTPETGQRPRIKPSKENEKK